MNYLNYLSVRDVSLRLEKSEETIKRWIRTGKLPAVKNSNREGWMILESDLEQVSRKSPPPFVALSILPEQQDDEKELISLAFQTATLLYPTEDILDALSDVGLKRALEVLLVMRQSPKPIRNPLGFIRKAIQEEWTPETVPVKVQRKQAVQQPARKEKLPDWFNKKNEDKKPDPWNHSESSTEDLLKRYELLKSLAEKGNQSAKEQLPSVQAELEKLGVSI